MYKLIVIVVIMALSGCAVASEQPPKLMVSSYEVKKIDAQGVYNIDILCDAADISVYTWKKESASFEVTRKVSGAFEKEQMDKKLEQFDIDITVDSDTIFLKSMYNGKDVDAMLHYNIYIPNDMDYISVALDNGSIRFLDDISGQLDAKLANSDIYINRFEGILNVSGERGNVSVSGGKIMGNSQIQKSLGNISIKTEFERGGEYRLCTNHGFIDVLTPQGSNISFETIGELICNDFLSNNASKTKVTLESQLGKISIKSY